MNKQTLIKHCLFCDDAVESYPFKDKTYGEIPVIRQKSNGKWFALIFILEEKLYINLKCNPVEASILREQYEFITPAWHMNKTHWNKVDVEKVPLSLLKALIKASFDLTV